MTLADDHPRPRLVVFTKKLAHLGSRSVESLKQRFEQFPGEWSPYVPKPAARTEALKPQEAQTMRSRPADPLASRLLAAERTA